MLRKITLVKSSRVHKTYSRCLDIWLRYVGKEHERRHYEHGDNLCHVVRVIVLGAPTAIAAQFLAWGLVACAIWEPGNWFGWWPFLRTCLWGAAGVGALMGIIYAGVNFKLPRSAEERVSTFRKLAQVYRDSALHDKICPHVDFVEESCD